VTLAQDSNQRLIISPFFRLVVVVLVRMFCLFFYWFLVLFWVPFFFRFDLPSIFVDEFLFSSLDT